MSTYAAQKVVPCPCGSPEPYWHGPEDGLREYCCDVCWARRKLEDAQRAFDEAKQKENEAKRLCALFDRLEDE